MPSKKWQDQPCAKDLAVVGHGRGATSYAAHWLNKQGIWVKHEAIGRQGIVESGFSVPTWSVRTGTHQGLTRDKYHFKAKACIVRDPYKVIGTYEQVEHPCAIMGHVPHLPGLLDGLLPPFWDDMSEEGQFNYFAEARELRVNIIARSAVRWTQAGIDWCEGEYFHAEDEWAKEMPQWLKDNGLWRLSGPHAASVPKNQINHRLGRRLTAEQINEMLRPDVLDELVEYRERIGYDG